MARPPRRYGQRLELTESTSPANWKLKGRAFLGALFLVISQPDRGEIAPGLGQRAAPRGGRNFGQIEGNRDTQSAVFLLEAPKIDKFYKPDGNTGTGRRPCPETAQKNLVHQHIQ